MFTCAARELARIKFHLANVLLLQHDEHALLYTDSAVPLYGRLAVEQHSGLNQIYIRNLIPVPYSTCAHPYIY